MQCTQIGRNLVGNRFRQRPAVYTAASVAKQIAAVGRIYAESAYNRAVLGGSGICMERQSHIDRDFQPDTVGKHGGTSRQIVYP